MSAKWERPAKTKQDLRYFTGELAPLTPEDVSFFLTRYEISGKGIFRGPAGRYLLPIYDPQGLQRGWVSRAPWPDSPLSNGPHRSFPKADTYIEKPGPVQSWYATPWDGGSLVLVEDQLSALKLADMGIPAVAVLGMPNSDKTDNYSGQDRVAEIARNAVGYDEVVVAFDADATEQSFKFVRKWGSAFHSPVRVAILERDIKDTPRTEIRRVLGVDNDGSD